MQNDKNNRRIGSFDIARPMSITKVVVQLSCGKCNKPLVVGNMAYQLRQLNFAATFCRFCFADLREQGELPDMTPE